MIERALEILCGGGLVAIPTETVYGLAADAENELAVRRIFAVKGRPSTHPLIVHLASAERAREWAREWPEAARKLAAAFWPGPLTLVVPRADRASDAVTGGQDTVALRVPAHPLALDLLRAFDGGLAAPSANRFGKVSPTTAEHVRVDLGGDVDLILEGGPCQVGVESTIVDAVNLAVLRPGGVPLEEIQRALGRPIGVRAGGTVRAPGMLEQHYAPRAGVVLARDPAPKAQALRDEGKRIAVLAPAGTNVPSGVALVPAPADVAAFARSLYALLREIDARGFDAVVVQMPGPEGLGLAVLDRLARASSRGPVAPPH